MKAKTKILLSSAALAAALAVTATSTFAWFSATSNPVAQGFDMNVQMRTDNVTMAVAKDMATAVAKTESDFRATILKADIEAVLTELGGGTAFRMGAATTTDGAAFTNAEGTSVSPNEKDTYLSLIFAFKADKAMDLNFEATSAKSTVTGATGTSVPMKAWKDITADEYGTHLAIAKGAGIPADVANAARVSFVATASATIPSDANTTSWATTGKIWEKNATAGYSKFGTNLANDYINFLNGTSIAAGTAATATSAWTGPANAVIPNANFAQKTGAQPADPVYAYLKVNVWLEGKDGDCFNSILQQILTVGLEFSGLVPNP